VGPDPSDSVGVFVDEVLVPEEGTGAGLPVEFVGLGACVAADAGGAASAPAPRASTAANAAAERLLAPYLDLNILSSWS
jgi:hypothetical protein